MKMTMTDRRTGLDSENLEELMCFPHRNKCLSAEKVNNIIEIWQFYIASEYLQKEFKSHVKAAEMKEMSPY